MRQLRNLRIPAALAAAAATVTLTAGAASASPTHHHPTGGSVTSSYSCTKEKIDGRYYDELHAECRLHWPGWSVDDAHPDATT